ncbi:MAG: hypothetical protein WBQ75_08320 [Acetobacteraceae bacterium]
MNRDLVQFVGSVPLGDSEQVFRRLSEELGPFVRRLPDGETAERARWIWFQREMLESHPAMEVDPTAAPLRLTQWDGKLLRETKLLRLEPAIDPDGVAFDTGYDRAALHSYAVFKRLRAQGAIPERVRFQVSLPTPMAPAYMYVSPAGRPAFLAAYERSLLAALGRIVASIPASDLAIQFDVCQEILVFENYFPERPADYKEAMSATLGRLGDAVPAGVELGFHLCYGSPADEHLVQPRDTAILVEVMNGIGAAVRRRIDYMHIPVPRNRDDDAYFAPLRDWRRRDGTRLYIGLIHHDDEAGDARRIAAAKCVVPEFGIASECGWGRSDPARLPGLLRSHRHAAQKLGDGA